MKGLVYTAPGIVETKQCDDPIENSEAIVKVRYSGICGTDLSILTGKHPRAKSPLILGHELSGDIVHIGENAQGLRKGDKVVAFPLLTCGKCVACLNGNEHVCSELKLIGIDRDGGMAEYISLDPRMLIKIPEDLDYDVASLIEPLAVVIHGIRQGKVNVLDKVLITGAGPIGLLTGIVLKEAGLSNVYISETDNYRLSISRELGLKAIDVKQNNPIDYIMDKTDNQGIDILIEASGVDIVAQQMTEMVRPLGTILMLSVYKQPALVDLRQINFKELRIIGSRVYNRFDFCEAVKYASRMSENLKRIITHRIPIDNGPQAFRINNNKEENCLKVLIEF